MAATRVATLPGGNAGNAAVACKDLLQDFASVKVVSKVAVGPEGGLLERELLQRGVGVEHIVTSEVGRTLEVCVIVEVRTEKARVLDVDDTSVRKEPYLTLQSFLAPRFARRCRFLVAIAFLSQEEKNSRTCLSLPRGDIVPDLTLEEVAKIRGDWVVFDGRHLETAIEVASRVKESGGKVVVEAEVRG